MRRYQRKRVSVDAFQMTASRLGNWVDWPGWLIEAHDIGADENGAIWADGAQAEWYIGTESGFLTVSPDDWIVRDELGDLTRYTSDRFRKLYEAAP